MMRTDEDLTSGRCNKGQGAPPGRSPFGLISVRARHSDHMNWLVLSIVASVVLTVVLNVGLRMFPGAGDRAGRRIEPWAPDPYDRSDPQPSQARVRVFFPWKLMLIASLVVTVLLNVFMHLR